MASDDSGYFPDRALDGSQAAAGKLAPAVVWSGWSATWWDPSVATCEVLRCPNRTAHAIRLSEDDARLWEAAVCDEHKAQMDAHAPWRWESDPDGHTAGAIVMGG